MNAHTIILLNRTRTVSVIRVSIKVAHMDTVLFVITQSRTKVELWNSGNMQDQGLE